MRAATARRLARAANEKTRPMTMHQLEFEIVLKHIEFRANTGVMHADLDIDTIYEQETLDRLERLGYEVENVQKSPTARPFWCISWERKVA